MEYESCLIKQLDLVMAYVTAIYQNQMIFTLKNKTCAQIEKLNNEYECYKPSPHDFSRNKHLVHCKTSSMAVAVLKKNKVVYLSR